jgi:hypothetical protein
MQARLAEATLDGHGPSLEVTVINAGSSGGLDLLRRDLACEGSDA